MHHHNHVLVHLPSLYKCNANTETSLNFKLIHFNMLYCGVEVFLDFSETLILSFEQERKALLCFLMFLLCLFNFFC